MAGEGEVKVQWRKNKCEEERASVCRYRRTEESCN
jgi:hypothetical protein